MQSCNEDEYVKYACVLLLMDVKFREPVEGGNYIYLTYRPQLASCNPLGLVQYTVYSTCFSSSCCKSLDPAPWRRKND